MDTSCPWDESTALVPVGLTLPSGLRDRRETPATFRKFPLRTVVPV